MKIKDNLDDPQMYDNSDGPGFSTPTRENSPCLQLYTKFPELNTIITPKTFKKKTLPKKPNRE